MAEVREKVNYEGPRASGAGLGPECGWQLPGVNHEQHLSAAALQSC